MFLRILGVAIIIFINYFGIIQSYEIVVVAITQSFEIIMTTDIILSFIVGFIVGFIAGFIVGSIEILMTFDFKKIVRID